MIFVVSSGNGQDVTVNVTPSSLNVNQGTSQTLRCSYTLPPAASYVSLWWVKTKDGSHIAVWTAVGDIPQQIRGNSAHPGFADRLSGTPAADFPALQSGHSLTFLSVQVEDAAEYYCSVSYWEDPNDQTTSSTKHSSTTTMNVQGESIKHTGKI